MVNMGRLTRSPRFVYGIIITLIVSATLPFLAQFLVATPGTRPVGDAFRWEPILVGLHLVTDLLIGLAYVAISATLVHLARKARQDIPFLWAFVAFGFFIISCGLTHFFAALTLWEPLYWIAGGIKYVTALASVGTALAIPPLVPQVMALVQTAKLSDAHRVQLESANGELAALTTQLREVDELKTQFFATVSHELRTPLALILGPLEQLRAQDGLTQEQQHNIDIMARNARTLLKHVNDLLDISRLDAGKMELHAVDLDLARLVRLTASQFEALAHERQLIFTVQTPATLPAHADPQAVQRAVVNILANAVKFTPAGGAVSCIVHAEDAWITIAIADSGPGVPPAMRTAVFDRFRQGDGGTTRHFGGTGLGLAIARDVVELHGGTITLGDAPQGGALFSIALPLVQPVEGAPLIEEESEQIETLTRQTLEELRPVASTSAIIPTPGAPTRVSGGMDVGIVSETQAPLVLVVEDNQDMRHFIAHALAPTYRTATARDGQEGLEQALALQPDLIITDVMMPRLSGDQLVRAVRARPQFDGVSVVILTAKADDDLRVRLLLDGAQDYLLKPFSSEELHARVGNLIALKRMRDVLQQEVAGQREDLVDMAREIIARRHEAEAATRAKDTFLSHAAHELKTPLTSLLGNLQLADLRVQHLLASPDSAAIATTLTRVHDLHRRADRQIDRLTRLVDDLLDTARIEGNGLELRLELCDLAALVRELVEEQRQVIPTRVIDLVLPDNAAISVVADADRIRQVVLNYLTNALKYAPLERPITVGAQAESHVARVWVRDEGPGIAVEDQELIWERSYQISGSGPRSGSHIGLGLGLYISRTIVELHLGHVGLESAVGKGATFWFTVPLRE